MGKNECNEAETEWKDKQKRQSRGGQRQRERVWRRVIPQSMLLLPLCCSCCFFLFIIICSNMLIRNSQIHIFLFNLYFQEVLIFIFRL